MTISMDHHAKSMILWGFMQSLNIHTFSLKVMFKKKCAIKCTEQDKIQTDPLLPFKGNTRAKFRRNNEI